MKINNFFDITSNILLKQDNALELQPNFKKCMQTYLVLRHLSCQPSLMPIVEQAQRLVRGGMSQTEIYKYLYTNVPKQRKRIYYDIGKSKTKSKVEK